MYVWTAHNSWTSFYLLIISIETIRFGYKNPFHRDRYHAIGESSIQGQMNQ